MDETTEPVLDPGRGQTKKGYFWAVASDDRGHSGPSPPIARDSCPSSDSGQSPSGSKHRLRLGRLGVFKA
ncbi:IS66 family transposase [Bradyrhizobium sp. USDA 4486]